ncbi:hypothetical protein HPB52_021184 [Rhipicephalus sanguineus]|uniref:F-box domain-containing protein n=1 Tax=Rhipicephalus sanguineus TaxID=34632 RepID=A0A9D4T6G2_RHISA|nr:hypothetical protein HPB52_021184 [Rhipicephalus sanguineus]
MSTPAAASQPTRRAHVDFLTLLPPEVWTEVFRHLDFESLVNMAQAAPELKCLALSPTILRRVTFDPEADERTVGMFLRATREELDVQNQVKDVPVAAYVEEVRFANCLVLSSGLILDCVQQCDNLRELYCVNCVVEPAELFVLLSTRLTRVTKLEWSLHDEKHYESRLTAEDIAIIGIFSKSEGPKFATMYVEVVATETTECLLDQFLTRCGMLRRLHVHAIVKGHSRASSMATCHRVFVSSALAMFELTRDTSDTATFRSSCEQDLSKKLESRVDQPHELHATFSPQSKIQYNIDLRSKPPAAFNIRMLGEVVKQGKFLQGFQQVTVCLNAGPQATSLFAEAADKAECWSDVARLTLALKNPTETEFPTSPTAHRGYEKPMRRFFSARVSEITELNLSAFHFATGCNGCDLVASTLPNLRALAVPPCGVNYTDSLESLADGCALLEHLDIRSSTYKTTASSCEECQLPLDISKRNIELLHEKTRLRRLSIDETAIIRNMKFLLGCRVQELRLSVDGLCGEELAQCPTELCRLLAANPRLSSLTLLARKVALCSSFAAALSQIQSLRHLCVLTTASHKYPMANDFFFGLEDGLPRLLTAHVHYTCVCKKMQSSSWIRQRRPSGSSKSGVGTSRTKQGLHLYDKPCLGSLCCIDSFIGLVRPRNRF